MLKDHSPRYQAFEYLFAQCRRTCRDWRFRNLLYARDRRTSYADRRGGGAAREFIAPELEGGRVAYNSKKSDTYSLGKVLYWLLSNGKIVPRERHREVEFDLRDRDDNSSSGWNNIYMEHVNQILDLMIVVDPEKRRGVENIRLLCGEAARLIRKEYTPTGKGLPATLYLLWPRVLPPETNGVRLFRPTPHGSRASTNRRMQLLWAYAVLPDRRGIQPGMVEALGAGYRTRLPMLGG